MKKYIDVVSGISAKGYDSFESAILVSQKQEPRRLRDKALVDGNQVEDYIFSGDRLVLTLDTGQYLEIFPEGERIGFQVSQTKPDLCSIEPDPALVLRNALGYEINWDWKDLLDAIIGKGIVLSLSDQFLFLLIQGQKDYYMIDYCKETNEQGKCYLTIGYA